MKIKHFWIILIFILASCKVVTVDRVALFDDNSIYVDFNLGNSSYDGKSIATPKKTIQQAVDISVPGDTIYIREGTYYENVVVDHSGTEADPITITNYNSESVVLNGGTNIALRAIGQVSYWVVENLTIRSSNRYTIRLGWWGEPTTSHWIVRNNTIFGANFLMGSYHLWEKNNIDGTGYNGSYGDAGISDAGDSHDNVYCSNTVHDFTHYNARGIWTQGFTYNTRIEDNIVYNIMAKSGLGQCIDLDGAAKVEWGHVVSNNTVSNCSYVGIQLENSFSTLVENNRIFESGYAGIIVINYNASVGCPSKEGYGDTDGDNSCRGDDTDNIIRQNIIVNSTSFRPGYGAIINWYAGGVDILGNTIVSATGNNNGGINIQGTYDETKGTTIINNIIRTGSGVSVCAQDFKSILAFNNNIVYRNGLAPFAKGTSCNVFSTLDQFKAETGLGLNSVVVDPKLSEDYSLLPDSPAIDMGVDIGSIYDIVGISIPFGAGYDIGAYEYYAEPTPKSTLTMTVSPTIEPTIEKTIEPTIESTPEPTLIPTISPTVSPTVEINIALNKTASQSNTLDNQFASLAVDGNTDGSWTSTSISSTLVNNQSWWEVDLGAIYSISEVVIWNRTDSGDWKFENYFVMVSDEPFISENLLDTLNQDGVKFYFSSSRADRPSEFNFNTTGRYVRIQLLKRDTLAIAEVEIFGELNYCLCPCP